MMTISKVQLVNTQDVAQLRELHHESQVYQHIELEGSEDNDRFNNNVADSFSENIVAEDTVILIAKESEVIGYIQIRLPGVDHVAWVDDLYVDPDMRGHGYATHLIEAGEELLKAEGATLLRIFTQAENDGARITYTKSGYRMVEEEDSYVYFEKRL
jgi:ribosomal protein S18 acetylase RimI-like enzyme